MRSKKKNSRQYVIPYIEYLEGFDWNVFGTLTPPFVLSQVSAVKAMERIKGKISDHFGESYRLFWVAERFKNGGYHVHYLLWIDSPTSDTNKKIAIEDAWKKAMGIRKRTNNKGSKYKKTGTAIKYMVKQLNTDNVDYGIGGNGWH